MQPIQASAVVHCADSPVVSWHTDTLFSLRDSPSVFRFQLSEFKPDTVAFSAILQADEHARAMRYHQPVDRQRFITGRALLRLLIHRYTGLSLQEISLVAGPNQKPTLANQPDVHFNISHAGNWLLLAFAHQPVGIDIEPIRADFAFADMLPISFSAEEQHWIRAASDPQKAFFTLWTRKEALAKGIAKGIDDEFARLPCLPGQHPLPRHLSLGVESWQLSSIPVADEYAAALAYPHTTQPPHFFSLDKRIVAAGGLSQ